MPLLHAWLHDDTECSSIMHAHADSELINRFYIQNKCILSQLKFNVYSYKVVT